MSTHTSSSRQRRGSARLVAILAGWLALQALAAFGAGTAVATEPLVSAVDSIGIPVTDTDRSIAFYTKVLHFREVSDRSIAGTQYEQLFAQPGLRLRAVRLRLGGESIQLLQYLSPPGRPVPVDARSDDRWFEHVAIIVRDMDTAYAWLRQHRVRAVSAGPQVLPAWNPAAAGIAAFYFKDPDGNPLEILQFPAGKGAPRWHQPTRALFLGIDHTAIAVASTAASLAYYRDTLGFSVAGESDNYGPEQERLSGVPGAHVHITTLRAGAGPGVELLEYVMPRTGRAYPPDSHASDHWQWILGVRARSGTGSDVIDALRHWDWISTQPSELIDGALGFHRALLLRDPDGHADNLILR
jgi:catechol 2,3-dioxygenase-like lactoylglutathione lyase family enzyme